MRGRSSQSGFTLTELMVVVVLAGIVTLGLVTFYLNSQTMWTEASTQALAQRDATIVVDFVRREIQRSRDAIVLPASGDSSNHHLQLYQDSDADPDLSIWWSPLDQRVHYGPDPGTDRGPVVSTVVERFCLTRHASLPLVHLDTLRVRSTSGAVVETRTTFALYNAP